MRNSAEFWATPAQHRQTLDITDESQQSTMESQSYGSSVLECVGYRFGRTHEKQPSIVQLPGNTVSAERGNTLPVSCLNYATGKDTKWEGKDGNDEKK